MRQSSRKRKENLVQSLAYSNTQTTLPRYIRHASIIKANIAGTDLVDCGNLRPHPWPNRHQLEDRFQLLKSIRSQRCLCFPRYGFSMLSSMYPRLRYRGSWSLMLGGIGIELFVLDGY